MVRTSCDGVAWGTHAWRSMEQNTWPARHGMAWHGMAWHGKARHETHALACHGPPTQCGMEHTCMSWRTRACRVVHVHAVSYTCMPCRTRACRVVHVHAVSYTCMPCRTHANLGDTCKSWRHMHILATRACLGDTCMSWRHVHILATRAYLGDTCMSWRHVHVLAHTCMMCRGAHAHGVSWGTCTWRGTGHPCMAWHGAHMPGEEGVA
eukprot:350735-Chlamydomonas_euryale.AAC.9